MPESGSRRSLQAAAERCGCELVLALAEIHETWECMEPGWDEPWRGRNRRWRRDEDDEWSENDAATDDPDAYELGDRRDHAGPLGRPGRGGGPADRLAGLIRCQGTGLFEREARARRSWQSYLARLRRLRRIGAGRRP